MPDPALPQPRPTPLPGTVRYRRTYADALGRPMTGTVTLTPKAGARGDGVTVPPAPVRAQVAAGLLDVTLQPDRYTLIAALRTVDGERVTDRDEITLERSA